jgi:ribose transport system ATP-binding protein
MVAIARALQDRDAADSGVLVLDEPTASLPAEEVEHLLAALRRYAAAGQTILYVTHRLEEVLDIADRATVLYDGRVTATVDRAGLDHERLVELIMGRRVERGLAARTAAPRKGRPRLRCEGLNGGAVHGVDFGVSAGEIVGVAGLLGSGRSTLLRLLFGATERRAGNVWIDGDPVTFRVPRDAMRAGVAYVPEDRAHDAAFFDLSVTDNLGMATVGEYFSAGRIRRSAERRDARDLIATHLIKAASEDAPFSSLSGGNQQKVILARWLRRKPRVILLDEPTQGVDVGARLEIWSLVRRAVDEGASVLVVSSDLEELSRVADRAIVLRRGRLVAELAGSELTQDRLDHLTLTAEEAA